MNASDGAAVIGVTVTPVEQCFDWLEHTDLSLWVSGPSMLAFPLILIVHTLGMGFLAGSSAVIALRILGIAPRVPLSMMAKFYPIVWSALVANFVSGVLLFIGYPYKAASNPVFYVKLGCVAVAVVLMVKIRNHVLGGLPSDRAYSAKQAQWLAGLSLVCWVGAISAGRLLAYTYTWLRVGVLGGF